MFNDLRSGTESLLGQHLLLITPQGSPEGFYVIVGDFGVYAVEVLQ